MSEFSYEKLSEKLDRMDARADERHEQTITRLTTIETKHDHLRADHDGLKKQCDGHDGPVRLAKAGWVLFSTLGLGGLWDYITNHRGH